jgi:Iap family predicted aminopeptidase
MVASFFLSNSVLLSKRKNIMKSRTHGLLSKISAGRMSETIEDLVKFGPRVAGTNSDTAIAEYVISRLRQCGLRVQTEEFSILAFDRGEARVWVNKPYSKEIPALPLIRSISTSAGGVSGPLNYAGMGREEDFASEDWTEILVLVDPPSANGVHQGVKLENAARHKAAGLIIYGGAPVEYVPSWAGPRSGTQIPAASIGHHDGMFLRRELDRRALELRLEISTSLRESQTRNIIATVPGRKRKDEIIMVCAHHDTVMTLGANDNGSGMAVVLELATLFAQEPCDRTLMFVLFGAEEGGHIGSNCFVKLHKKDLLENIKALVNIDAVAVGGKLCVVEKSRKAGNQWVICSPWLNGFLVDQALGLGYQIVKCVSDFGTSDEGPFLEAGVPASWIWKPDDPYYHTEIDKAQRINSNDLKVVADLVGSCMLDLGSEGSLIKQDQ